MCSSGSRPQYPLGLLQSLIEKSLLPLRAFPCRQETLPDSEPETMFSRVGSNFAGNGYRTGRERKRGVRFRHVPKLAIRLP